MSPATTGELARLLDQVPVLAVRPRTLEDLTGGLTNRNVKVTNPEGVFVARCSDTGANALGIDRDVEHANSVAADRAGVGAPVVDYRPELGVLVVGYLEGRTLSNETMTEPGVLERVARACRQLHEGPSFQGRFDMFDRQRRYLQTMQRGGFRIPAGYLDHTDAIERVRRALTTRDEGLVPCNNDLLAENYIDDGDRVRIIDYEYSGMNDACFELGNTWCECRLSTEHLEELVAVYYGRSRRSRVARARLLGVVGAYGWTLWGAIQHATSSLDFDFWQWAVERFEIAARELTGPGLDALLADAQLED